MPIWDLYSKRKRAQRGSLDVFIYDSIPNKLRVQIVHILTDAYGDREEFQSNTDEIWKVLHQGLAREYGKFKLGRDREPDALALCNYFLATPNEEEALDIIERAFIIVDGYCRNYQFTRWSSPKMSPDDAIAELNERFLENGVGYQFAGNMIIRNDSQVIHKEIILPALHLLADQGFSGANEEYRAAHEHYRSGRPKECINECLKAFESTMKSICNTKHWKYGERDSAKNLIEVLFTNELIPQFLQSEFSSLRTALESGIPTTRNRVGAHGQGEKKIEIPNYLASYLLGLTASSIRFLVDAAK